MASAAGVALVAALSLAAVGCAAGGPTVVVEHALGATTVVRNVRFNGCVWPATLKLGEATMPSECLSGPQRVYYEALDVASGSVVWTAYQTTFEIDGGSGEDVRVQLHAETQEKDVTAPGPFGH